jgi:hypothetical protein
MLQIFEFKDFRGKILEIKQLRRQFPNTGFRVSKCQGLPGDELFSFQRARCYADSVGRERGCRQGSGSPENVRGFGNLENK